MIDRYADAQISYIFEDQNKFALWQKIELYYLNKVLLLTNPEKGLPSRDYLEIKKHYLNKKSPNIKKVKDYEVSATKHEFVAFLKELDSRLSCEEARKVLHLGLTSSDIIDTASVIQFKQAANILLLEIGKLYQSLSLLLSNLEGVNTIGRTHGRHAEPIDFRDRIYNFLKEIMYCANELKISVNNLPGMLSGPVGSSSQLNKEAALSTLDYFGLPQSTYVSQALPRYLFSKPIWAMSLLMSCYERFATLIRLSSIDEINELQEPFSKGQCGSSSMPHKKNPITAENICGLARLSRSHVQVTLENISLWWERDISHSSTERVIWPDAFHLAVNATKKLTLLLEDLQVNRNEIKRNLLNSSHSSHKELCESVREIPRTVAYDMVKEKYLNDKD